MAAAAEKKKSFKDAKKPKFEYKCSRCGKQIILPVELDASRPIYCEECIEIVRAERKGGKPSAPVAPKPAATPGVVTQTAPRPPVAPAPTVATVNVPASAKPATVPAPVPKASVSQKPRDARPQKDLPPPRSLPPVQKPSSPGGPKPPALTLAELAAKAGPAKRVVEDDDELGPDESDVPEIPLNELMKAAMKEEESKKAKTGTLKPGETALFD